MSANDGKTNNKIISDLEAELKRNEAAKKKLRKDLANARKRAQREETNKRRSKETTQKATLGGKMLNLIPGLRDGYETKLTPYIQRRTSNSGQVYYVLLIDSAGAEKTLDQERPKAPVPGKPAPTSISQGDNKTVAEITEIWQQKKQGSGE